MTKMPDETIKKNVSRFEDDVKATGSYAYTATKLSSQFANARISEFIQKSYDFSGKTVLDLGCGDGTYSMEFPALGVKELLGVDPASAAIDAANANASKRSLDKTVRFEVGNIYDLNHYYTDPRFDCIVLRGVLHHLPDPARAIAGLADFKGTIVVLEPNGNNPVLKLLEKYSKYHVEHEERSFAPSLICSWLESAGFRITSNQVLNLVPMFCPDWMAIPLRSIGLVVERVPFLRDIACGQSIIVSQK